MGRHMFIEQLEKYGELDTAKGIKIWAGQKVIERELYYDAAVSRGFYVNPDRYYVFVSDKGHVYECITPSDAVDAALLNMPFDYTVVEDGDFVDFGPYGCFYVCGENIDGTKFLASREPQQDTRRPEDCFYIEKNLAVNVIEKCSS